MKSFSINTISDIQNFSISYHILLDKMDKRLPDHLYKKARLTEVRYLKRSHQLLANELGISREVITRMLKKMESEGKIEQSEKSVKIIDGL